jgi:hypothetical protein
MGVFREDGTMKSISWTNWMGPLRTPDGVKVSVASFLLLSQFAVTVAQGYTECHVTPESAFAGDEGTFYITYSNGGSSLIGATDPDFKQTVALITASIFADKEIDVRYAADGVSCTATMQTLIGVRIYK